MVSTKVSEILANLTNKEKVEIIREIVLENNLDPLYGGICCCISCNKIGEMDDSFHCEFCNIVKCEDCAEENMKSYQKCDTCMDKVCGKCGTELYNKSRVAKCRVCSQRFCKACKYVKTDTCVSCLAKSESEEEEEE